MARNDSVKDVMIPPPLLLSGVGEAPDHTGRTGGGVWEEESRLCHQSRLALDWGVALFAG